VNEHIAITAQIRSVSGPVDIRGYGVCSANISVTRTMLTPRPTSTRDATHRAQPCFAPS
jgi:hypothetical protein